MDRGDEAGIRRILLVGFMGSGKTTVGSALAALLDWTFLDIDEAVADAVGLSIADIFAKHGELFFREREHLMTLEALMLQHHVLASGGGWPVVDGRMDALGEGTVSVYLDASESVLKSRLRQDRGVRPLIGKGGSDQALVELLRRRLPYYRMADLTVDGNATVQAVAHSIARSLFEDRVPPRTNPITTDTPL